MKLIYQWLIFFLLFSTGVIADAVNPAMVPIINYLLSDTVSNNQKIFIIGDSTVRFDFDGERDVNGSLHRTGWGSKLSTWMLHPENVFNRARRAAIAGGVEDNVNSYRREAEISAWIATHKGPYDWNTTRTLIENEDISHGAFLLIQFGANDKYADISEVDFKSHLLFYIEQARALGITPILLTPINPKSTLSDNREPYIGYIFDTALSEGVAIIDLYSKSLEIYAHYTREQRYGLFGAWQLDGITRDTTHLDRQGATIVSGWVKDISCSQQQTQKLCKQFDTIKSFLYAYAGEDQNLTSGEILDLNGTGLDTNGEINSYRWSENGVVLSNEALLSYSSDIIGVHTLTLVLTDNEGNVATDTIDIDIQELVVQSVTHEDAEDGDIEGWAIYDNDPEEGSVSNVLDSDKGGRVIELSGAGVQNGYSLTNLNIDHGFFVSWYLKFNEDFEFYVKVRTSGHDPLYIYYTPENESRGFEQRNGKEYIHIGLGTYAKDNRWIHFTRDIDTDLKNIFPDESVELIYGFYIRGSGRVDDIQTANFAKVSKLIHREDHTFTTANGADMRVSVYYHDENIVKPTLYFVAGGALDHHEYEHLLHHLVNEGYVVVAASYDGAFNDTHIRDNFFEAFVEGRNICEAKGINDDTRTGLIGHSSGAGTLPSLAYKFFVEQGMGSNGRFVFGATPWVDFQWENNMSLPYNTNFVTQWYEDDHGTEPKIYLDMYKRMDVNHKTFSTVKQSADHYTIKLGVPLSLVENAIYEPLDNLAKYTFTGVNKDLIFPENTIDNAFMKLLEAGTLPSNTDFDTMIQGFIDAGSAYDCNSSNQGYSPNPRVIECQGYRNKLGWYPLGDDFVSIATDTAVAYPQYLGSVLGSIHANKISRISDDVVLHVNHPYPKTPSWNIDGSLLLLTNALLDGKTYSVIKENMDWSDGERKWSNLNPKSYFAMQWARDYQTHDCVKDNYRLVRRDVNVTLNDGSSPATVVLDNNFSCAYYDDVTLGSYEGNIDRNDRYVVISAKKVGENNVTAIVFNMQNHTRTTTKILPIRWHEDDNASKRIFDWISVSPLGDYILLNFIEEPDRVDADYRGAIYEYDIHLNFIRKLADQGSHGDIGIDANGAEMYVQFEYGADRGIWGYPLDGSARVRLLPDKYGGGHISCRNTLRDGWCYVSTTQEGYREVFALSLDGSEVVERFAQTHTEGSNNSHGGVDAKGEKMIFKSTWDGKSSNQRRETFVVEGL